MANSDRPTIIEKYANRRLYNTGTFTFVTLDDLAAMVKRGKNFRVYDAKTGADSLNQFWRISPLNRRTPTAHDSHSGRS
jgi:polyhydroxyalkanoate synthesis regulator protein